MAMATTFFPTPVSPVINTVASEPAANAICSLILFNTSEEPISFFSRLSFSLS
jgi:hypothetical protein